MAGFLGSEKEGKKVKSTGWTAFDRKMKGNDRPECDHDRDPFPPVSDLSLETKLQYPAKSFSSVVRTGSDSSSLQHQIKVQDFIQNHAPETINDVSDTMSSIKRLKSIHGWADESLISDILAGADDDEDKASALLEAMVSPKNEIIPENHILLNFALAPSEPEWTDDDVYLSYRKDAIKMMRYGHLIFLSLSVISILNSNSKSNRSAANHSRAAANAYQRGDHHSARKLSLKAQEERLIAEEMNRKAAQNILLTRNSDNDRWKLDFHGLHASEAVGILKEHLFRIESLLSSENSVSPGNKMTSQRVLHVVTGTGNHSKGPAALPAAVRGFLIEKGYRFDEERPGVIAVWPKFRRSSTARD